MGVTTGVGLEQMEQNFKAESTRSAGCTFRGAGQCLDGDGGEAARCSQAVVATSVYSCANSTPKPGCAHPLTASWPCSVHSTFVLHRTQLLTHGIITQVLASMFSSSTTEKSCLRRQQCVPAGTSLTTHCNILQTFLE